MTKSIIAHPAQEPQTRVARGRRLFEEHGDEIRFDPVEKVWLVSSQHDGTSVYEVTLGREEICECQDFSIRHPEGGCKHIVAATLVKAKTFRCEGCGDRFPNRDLFEVPEHHLTFFEGDAICEECALDHAVL